VNAGIIAVLARITNEILAAAMENFVFISANGTAITPEYVLHE
jgi:hypothetical protein